ncbi:MBL fold metallo-hydrolase [Amphritea japonica]|uniref:Metallo-beta-lactamase family protein n=1 Tax=Amphritea japonica ATCC BAA-1530 TaxID=1278309 RepID=A0A7R6PFD6_9GAMM|nr:MBL fold metallo-hydrolase [Amphritea japonica]BBB25422.1 metallo-beta-lactamase family protein [Amphritea japonica ATCC BAA-1530]
MKYSIIPVTPFQQNCTLLWCEQSKKVAVVDPGGDIEKVLEKIADLGLTLEKILLTHAHIDHAGGTAELAKQTGVPIEGPHIGDKFWIDALSQQSQMFGFPQVEMFTPDRWLEDGDSLTVGEETLQVLHCPGHTPGHVVFYSIESQLAQVGDVLFQGSIGRTDFPQGDHDTLIGSIREKLFPLGDEVAFIPGHGPMSTLGHERQTNPFVSDSRG